MKIKLFDKDICEDRFYFMIADTLDAFCKKDEQHALLFAETLREDITNIIDKTTEDWIGDNATSPNSE